MSIKAEFIGMKPAIEVETNRFFKDGKVNFVSIEIGDLVLELDEKDADYLREKIDFALWDETKEDLENKVEDLELLKTLFEEVGGVYDYDNTEFKISEIYYDKEEGKVFMKVEEY